MKLINYILIKSYRGFSKLGFWYFLIFGGDVQHARHLPPTGAQEVSVHLAWHVCV